MEPPCVGCYDGREAYGSQVDTGCTVLRQRRETCKTGSAQKVAHHEHDADDQRQQFQRV